VVDADAAGQADVQVLPVFEPGDEGEAGVDGAALGGVLGERVAEFGIVIIAVQKTPSCPPQLAGRRVRADRPPHEQTVLGDGVDAEQVAVGQDPAGCPGLQVGRLRLRRVRQRTRLRGDSPCRKDQASNRPDSDLADTGPAGSFFA
jgi:hypothetical protein